MASNAKGRTGGADDWKRQEQEVPSGGRAALKAETLGNADSAILTVTDVDRFEVDDPDAESGKRMVYVLHSEEYAGMSFFLNRTGMRTLMEQISKTPADWVGKRVPVVKVRVNNPRTGSPTKTLQVAPPGEWGDILALAKKRGARSGGRR